jgi:hypothetical protein
MNKSHTTVTVVMNIDFAALEKQKSTLFKMSHGLVDEISNDVSGIIHLLDDLQDKAATLLGEDVVFPEMTSRIAEEAKEHG